jgi:microcystin-dependent protein
MASPYVILTGTTTSDTMKLQTFATDGAFVTAKGSAASEGDIYYNTTAHVVKEYNGTSWFTIGTTTDIATDLASSILAAVPTGIIWAYGGTTAPTGFLLCNGASVLRATYPDLFTAIGTAFGAADGTHFNVPDLRGIFLRGANNTKATGLYDPDASGRSAMASGGNTGDAVGSVQDHNVEGHVHTVPERSGSAGTATGDSFTYGAQSAATTGSTGGNETRPVNAYVNYIIKF